MAYVLRYKLATASSWEPEVTMTTNPTYVTGLVNGSEYDFQVRRDTGATWSTTAKGNPKAPVQNNTESDSGTVQSTTSIAGGGGAIYRYADRIQIVFSSQNWDYVKYTYTINGTTTTTTVNRSGGVKTVVIYVPRTIDVSVEVKAAGNSPAVNYTIQDV